MITANIKNAERYFGVNPNFESAFNFLKTLNKDSASGDFEFENFSGGISVLQKSDTSDDGGKRMLEAHRDYLDIHYVIEGCELMGYANADSLKAETEYNKEDDYLLLSGDMNKFVMHEGDFCIVFPEDAHLPGMCAKDSEHLKKAVIKIKLPQEHTTL